MAGLSDALEASVLNWMVNNTAFPAQTAGVFLSAHTADPGEAGTTAEITGVGNYARINSAGKWATATVGSVANNAQVDFVVASGANWGLITHIGVWSLVAAGVYKGSLVLATPLQINIGNQLQFFIGDLVITAD